jgi:ubiquinone/menaquinone biosynthesis C-methylase UbiE/uncharacterized membrane protein YbhN (UPF0104 family)
MKRWRLFLFNIAFISIGFGICIAWIYLSGGRELIRELTELPSGVIFVLPLITGYWIFARFIRWQYILRRIDVRVPLRGGLGIYLASLPGTATPAYVGEGIRSLFMRQQFGFPISITLWALIIERMLDFIGLGIIALVTSSSKGLRLWTLLILSLTYLVITLGNVLVKRYVAVGRVRLAFQRLSFASQALAITFPIWMPPALLISLAALSLHVVVPMMSGMNIYTTATILGGITLMPAGFGATGSIEILKLQGIGIPLTTAVLIISLVRLMSTGISLVVGTIFLYRQVKLNKQFEKQDAVNHFNEIAKDYGGQFSAHVWNHLLERKLDIITTALPYPPFRAGIGLDIGCGLGIQCSEMIKRGYQVIGLDPAFGLVRQGKLAGVPVVAGDALELPFRDSSVQFVYMIGVLHHLSGVEAQQTVCREVVRVLKPGGVCVVHETNSRNPLFRFYMGYIFPFVKSIDEGTERWVEADHWNKVPGMDAATVHYFTFIPDFIPRFSMGPALAVERFLERSIFRHYSVHYAAVLQKSIANEVLSDRDLAPATQSIMVGYQN